MDRTRAVAGIASIFLPPCSTGACRLALASLNLILFVLAAWNLADEKLLVVWTSTKRKIHQKKRLPLIPKAEDSLTVLVQEWMLFQTCLVICNNCKEVDVRKNAWGKAVWNPKDLASFFFLLLVAPSWRHHGAFTLSPNPK